ncbi:type VI secretion system protein ImpF [Methylobacterium brachiatum]|jgi:type VI secretion system protein ImpF|uniref:Type VI secretion system protein ImpF n=1 Tax=Methylobacterium brachiatum TaxID=269660 RepID=A0AAJ1WZ49_9HYPH|nr:type VI secretion system baseplate subunit TssE [Methylobacterium brachiatum]MCB4805499.1 type VI secretion system baseplate subunit TssE [Methylobacterium brachiatum]MDQ0546550.1 type VI secretion system protein ImpF [Methylobacterium brachiatum]
MNAKTAGGRARNPLMDVFRTANSARDARLRIERRDASGGRIVSGHGAHPRSAINAGDLQRSVSTDLERLMNTVHLAADIDLSAFPHVRRSILNHGFVDIARMSIDDAAVNGIAMEIELALRTFEPRLAPSSIVARRDDAADPNELKLRFVVRAEIRADPLNVPVEFIADLERDTGRIKVARR